VIWLVFVGITLVLGGTPGSFRGKIVDGPNSGTDKKWLYVQGRNGMVRRVEVAHARVEYDDNVPTASRSRDPEDALKTGAEVRITAEQGSDGEWRASRVEILSPAEAPKTTQSAGRASRPE
jgi:hypothetical protein